MWDRLNERLERPGRVGRIHQAVLAVVVFGVMTALTVGLHYALATLAGR